MGGVTTSSAPESCDRCSGVEEPHQCSLPGVPPDPGGHRHLLRHAADGDPVEADHPVVRREHHVQAAHDGKDRGLHPLLPPPGRPQHRQVGK